MFDADTRSEIDRWAALLDVDPAALMAIVEVESAGRLYARIGERNEPLIRFEGHYFDRLLTATLRVKARQLGLASPKVGTIRNPRHQSQRWKLLGRAIELDRTAALSSCSWGVGQVMGAHWRWLGYESVEELVAQARSGGAGQIALMLRYVDKAGLVVALQESDWTTFARLYNGPAYARHGYHRKIKTAYEKHALTATKPKSELVARPSVTGTSEIKGALPDVKKPGVLRAIHSRLLSIFKRIA